MKRLVLLSLAVILVGCAGTKPPVIQSKCMGERPAKPQYEFATLPDATDEASAANAVRILYLDWMKAVQYGRDYEIAASGCL